MSITIKKIPGGLSVDGLELRNGKCGCTSVAPCCYSWSKTKQSGKTITYRGKTTGPEAKDVFTWSFIVKKGELVVDVAMEDCRDKDIKFKDLPDDWKCPVCKAGKDSFEQAG